MLKTSRVWPFGLLFASASVVMFAYPGDGVQEVMFSRCFIRYDCPFFLHVLIWVRICAMYCMLLELRVLSHVFLVRMYYLLRLSCQVYGMRFGPGWRRIGQ